MKHEMAKMAKEICMPRNEFIKEHVHLIDVLKNGKREARMMEARKQERELARCMGRPTMMMAGTVARPQGMKHGEGSPLMHMYDLA
jgi:hypothetical protein